MVIQERAKRTRNALIRSAAELFDRDGFESATLAAISARAGVSNGALLFHFPNKAALLEVVVTTASERLWRITRERRVHPLQMLIDATHDLVRGLRQDVVLRAGFRLRCPPESALVAPDLWREWQEWVGATVRRVERAGSTAPGGPPHGLSAAVVAVTAGLESLGSRDPRWLEHGVLTRFWVLLLPRLVGPAADSFVPAGRGVADGDPGERESGGNILR